jgi:hypothetical protein
MAYSLRYGYASAPTMNGTSVVEIALIPQPLLPILGEGEPEQLLKVPLPELGEGFRVRATKVSDPHYRHSSLD